MNSSLASSSRRSGCALLVDALEVEMRRQLVAHGDGAAEVERKPDLVLIDQLDRDFAIFDDAAVDIGPANGKLALPGRELIGAVDDRYRARPLQRAHRQNEFGAPGRNCRHRKKQDGLHESKTSISAASRLRAFPPLHEGVDLLHVQLCCTGKSGQGIDRVCR